MSWRRTSATGIGAAPPPYRPLVRPVVSPSFKYTIFRIRARDYNSAAGGWQAWSDWSEFDNFEPRAPFWVGNAVNDSSGTPPTETRKEVAMEVAMHGSPWAITWINTITPLAGGEDSEEEHYRLILPGSSYTFTLEAEAGTSKSKTGEMISLPAP